MLTDEVIQSVRSELYLGEVFNITCPRKVLIDCVDPLSTAYHLVAGAFICMFHHKTLRRSALHHLPDWDDLDTNKCYLLRLDSILYQAANTNTPAKKALEASLLGAFVRSDDQQTVFSGADFDSKTLLRGACTFAPSAALLQRFVNGLLPTTERVNFGHLRFNEDQAMELSPQGKPFAVKLSMTDFKGKRTAVFGKTRLGKSNAVKVLIQSMRNSCSKNNTVGQLIFDVNGEYANRNHQDVSGSIASLNPACSKVYYLANTSVSNDTELLRFNFYERPHEALAIFSELLPEETSRHEIIQHFLSMRLPAIPAANTIEHSDYIKRSIRKIMLFWTVLYSAGFEHNETRLKQLLSAFSIGKPALSPGYSQDVRLSAYQAMKNCSPPANCNSFTELMHEMSIVSGFVLRYPNDPSLSAGGRFLFDSDEELMAKLLVGQNGVTPYSLRPCMQYHSPCAIDFKEDILHRLDEGNIVIVDLAGANQRITQYFARTLSEHIFAHQEHKFIQNRLGNHYLQIYFEEAHMLFPSQSRNTIDVYARFAKEGAKFHIGILYATQSPTSISPDLLSQTENFLVGHLASISEVNALLSAQVAFHGLENQLMYNRTVGFMRLLTASQRYVLPVQVNKFEQLAKLGAAKKPH